MEVSGHASSELWRKFTWKSKDGIGHYIAFNQQHCGEVVRLVDGEYKNLGTCPLCNGTTRITCTTCKGDGKCNVCQGNKTLIQGKDVFTIADTKGRSMVIIPRAITDETVEGLRMPDLLKVTLPLANLAPESSGALRLGFKN